MKRKIIIGILFNILAFYSKGQSLRIYNLNDQSDISGSTITIQSPDNNGWVGYESLDLYIRLENSGANALEIGAKKIEADALQPDVQHTICFAGLCYPTTVYTSPYHVTLVPGQSDSGFVAHYLFDNRVHIRGINHVVYVFYDVNNPSDSVFINVIYNTEILTAFNNYIYSHSEIIPYPNPANEQISFNLPDCVYGCITDSKGNRIAELNINSAKGKSSFDTSELTPGIYFYSFFNKQKVVNRGRFLISH